MGDDNGIEMTLILRNGPPWGFRMAARDDGGIFVSQVSILDCYCKLFCRVKYKVKTVTVFYYYFNFCLLTFYLFVFPGSL